MKNLFVMIFGIMIFSTGCSENSEKNVQTRNVDTSSEKPQPDEDFDFFYKKFCSDSVFQKERIEFPILLKVLKMDETRVDDTGASGDHYNIEKIEKSDWAYVNYKSWEKDFVMEFHKGPGVYTVEFTHREVGMAYMHIFKSDAGKWKLVEMIDLST